MAHSQLQSMRPNTRMQRTRSSPSALRSPLMRCPLGRLALVASLAFLGLAPQRQGDITAADLEDIRETIFRYGIEKCPEGYESEGAVYFLGLWDRGVFEDPSSQLLERFAKPRFPLKPISASVVDSQFHRRDRLTGALGSLYTIGAVRRLSSSQLEAEAGYCAMSVVLRLHLKNGKWQVVSERIVGVA